MEGINLVAKQSWRHLGMPPLSQTPKEWILFGQASLFSLEPAAPPAEAPGLLAADDWDCWRAVFVVNYKDAPSNFLPEGFSFPPTTDEYFQEVESRLANGWFRFVLESRSTSSLFFSAQLRIQ